MNKVFIETYGCQMNVYDTELVKSILTKNNYSFVPKEEEADIVMLNTCAIRENAHRKVYGRIQQIINNRGNPVKGRGPHGALRSSPRSTPLIGILGCMATNLRTDLFEDKNLKIDFIAGPDSYKRLPQLIAEASNDTSKAYDLTLSEFETYSDVFPKQNHSVGNDLKSFRTNAWIAVMRGCNNFCTFCVVPYTRGRERSRSIPNVVAETKHLAQEGFKQVTLLGQNVNSYKEDSGDFADLLNAVSEVDGIERIRFTSPHPKDFPRKLLKVIRDNPKVCKQLHMPLQAGNDRILDIMNRTYTKQEFLDLINETRDLIPNVALSTDVIVGFSSETDEEFEDTYDVMKQVEFDSAFIFKYSERKNTIAEKKFPDDIPEAVKTERIVRLNELQKEISLKKYSEQIGKTLSVLLEKTNSHKSETEAVGRTDDNKLVVFPNHPDDKPGDFVKLKITEASPHTLRGQRI